MKLKRSIHTELALQSAIGEARKMFKEAGYVRWDISDEKPRSLPQNALAAVWYDHVARELGDTAENVKAECKLRFGVPILRAQDEEFRAMYDNAIKGRLSYEQKLAVMRYLPVTSLMSTGQLSLYLEQVQQAYATTVQLQWPEEWMRAA